LDAGLYSYNGMLQFYSSLGSPITGPDTVFTPGQLVHVMLTRDALTNQVSAYANGVLQFTFTDTDGEAVFSGPNNVVHLLQDDVVTEGMESTSGVLGRVRIWGRALTADEVQML
jgi:hypothetical protein